MLEKKLYLQYFFISQKFVNWGGNYVRKKIYIYISIVFLYYSQKKPVNWGKFVNWGKTMLEKTVKKSVLFDYYMIYSKLEFMTI